MRAPLLPLMFVFTAAALFAQAPSEGWMTIETAHFRLHYPAAYEAWTLHLASRMESIRRTVTEEVGFVPPDKADVLVMDPVAQSNGMAIPFLKYPRMVLWATPPESWSPIGHYRDWPELLFLHEDVHLVHLLRPSRGGWGKFVEWLLPLGAVDRKVPRWASEGYATYLEGKLTGVGRPNGDFRAAILRKWALEGTLPSYGQMSNDTDSWMGMSMAYLMGSAYMEWLAQRTDDGAWKRLWARLTAKKNRTFDAAFEGVFGDPPAKLYDRFTADLTWRAKELERTMKPILAEGELWQDTSWTTGEPALSPDGSKMAIVLRGKDEPSRLLVWDPRPDLEAQKKWDESIEKIRKEDPEDSPGVRTKPFPHKELSRMPLAAAKEPTNPRWMPDGKSILFTSYEPDTDGFYSPDLYLWTPESGEVRRVTKGAHVKEADPFPDGRRAVAVQSRFGATGLAEVDLTSGGITSLREPSVEVVYSQPRVSPDGTRLVTVRHADGAWSLAVMDLNSTGESTIRIPDGALPSFPAWSRDGRGIFASIAAGGFIDIHRSDPGLKEMGIPMTRMMGGAIAAEPTPDGKGLYFLSLEPDGLDVRYIPAEPDGPMAAVAIPDPSLGPAVRPVPSTGSTFKDEAVGASKPYGGGRQEFSFLFGGHWTSYTEAWEAGVRGGDVLGRWDYFAIYSYTPGKGFAGGALAAAYRGWPVELTLHYFYVDDHLGSRLVNHYEGVELRGSKEWKYRMSAMIVQAGVLEERRRVYEWFGDYGHTYRLGFVQGALNGNHPIGEWDFPAALLVRHEWGAIPDILSDHFQRDEIAGTVGVHYSDTALSVKWTRRTQTFIPLFTEGLTFGGIQTSVLPESFYYGQILSPAFYQGPSISNECERIISKLEIAGLPVFYERDRFGTVGRWGDWISFAGLEWDMTSGPLAIARLPGLHLTLGGAYIFDAPQEGKTRFWLGLSWTP